ncbi:DUF5979 domain-containing protein [Cellulomonas septica]|uniref:DUF11 domain-containing protein n=1 Tax=Cellulomonas septica TaxID=285080 RepID=A0ABX1JVT5_9CELL|nr:DUF5979 domain-containing protein [Cellulomonas septica]NKY38074.1 DUF11 domain-containing protein [Cellulomonas septica]
MGDRRTGHGPRRDVRGRRRWAVLAALALVLPTLVVAALPAAAADWGIQKVEVSSGPYQPGDQVQWVVTVSCSDPNASPCTNAVLTDPLPDGIELVSASIQSGPPGGTITADTGTDTVTYTNPSVPNGAQAQIVITAQIADDISFDQSGVPITNTATVTADNAAQQSASDAVTPTVPLQISSSTTKEIAPPGAVARPGTPATITLGSTNTSNDAVDTLVIQDPVDPTADPNPFTYLEYDSIGTVVLPPNADNVIEEYWDGAEWLPLDAAVDPADVQGVRYTFSGDIQPGATASVPVNVVQSDAVTELTAQTTVANDTSSVVTHPTGGTSTPTTADDTYVITPPNNSVTARKSFDPSTVSAGEPTTVTIGATNDGDPTTSMSITEPSPGTPSPFEGDNPLTFVGFGPSGDGTGVQWPADADAASVTFTCAEGPTLTLDATAPDTLPNPPPGCTIVGFTVEFTGDIVTGGDASVPFVADTDPDQVVEDVTHPNEITADIPNATGTASADLVTLTDRLATQTTKNISPSIIPAFPGQTVLVQLPSQLLPFGPDGSTTDAEDVVIQDPTDPTNPGPFWGDFTATAVRSTDVPPGATLTISYWDGTAWVTDPDCGTFTGPTTVSCDLPPDAQGVQFAYHSDAGFPPGENFQPNFLATYDGPPDQDAPLTNCGASSASTAAVGATPPAEGCAAVDPFPVDPDPGDLDFIDKTFLGADPVTVRARTEDQVTAQLTWSTNGFVGVQSMVLSDIADPATTTIAQSFYDAFDLVRVEAVDPAVDPLIPYDAITGVELFVGGAWVDAAGDPCSVAAPCDGSFPGYTLTADEREDATAVRLTYVESPTRGTVDPTAPQPGEGVARSTQADGRHLNLTFQVRDERRSDGSPVLGSTNGTIYNVPTDPGLVDDTARGTATFGDNEYTDTDADDVLILDQPINVGIDKTWTGGPLSVPPEGTPADAYPSTTVQVTATNNSVARVDTMRIAEPSAPDPGGVVEVGAAPGTSPFDVFTLTGISVVPPAGTAPVGDPDFPDGGVTVVLTSVGGTTAELTEAEAEALTAAELADVVGVEARFDGRITSGAQGVLDLTLLLREFDRYDPTTRVNVADYSPVPNSAGAEVADPGGTPGSQDPQAWDDATMELDDAEISMVVGKSFTPATVVEPGSDAEDNPTSVLALTGQPTGPSRAVSMTLVDVDGSFWNQYDLVGFDASTLTAPIDRVRVDAYTGGTYDPGTDTFVGGTWTNGTPGTTFSLPAGVAAADVTGVRFTFTRSDGAIWENPANPTQAVNLEVQVRDTLRSDPATPVPTDLAGNLAAPGETAAGLATNDVDGTVTGADLVVNPDDPTGPLVPVSADETAQATITYAHATNAVQVVKTFAGVVTGGTQPPDAVFPMAIAVTNTGNRPIFDLDVVDDPMPADADGAQLRLAEGVDDPFSYALTGAAPTPPNGDPLPTTDAGTDGDVTVTQGGDLESLEFTIPDDAVLEVGQTYTITVLVQFRVGLPAGTVVLNTTGVTGDRPWDGCATRLDPATGQCQADADVTPIPAAVLSQAKLVKATADDELDVLVDPDAPTPPAGGCVPDADGFYAYPCTPVIAPGHDETWRIVVNNVGNLPLNKVVIYDRLPIPGDTGSYASSARGSQFRPILDPNVPPLAVNVPSDATVTFWYSTTQNYCMTDLTDPLNEPSCPTDDATTGWVQLTGSETDAVYESIVALKAVISFPESDPFTPGESIALEGATTTPAEVPDTGGRSIAWNSAAASGVVVTPLGDLNLLPTEGTKVGVATASGPLEVTKEVTGDGAAYAPDAFDLFVQCTSAVGTWQETVLDPIPVTVTPGTPLTVLNLPYGAQCTITEDGSDGQTELLVGTVTIESETAPTLITAVNRYDLTSLQLSKAVESEALDQDGDPVPFGPFEVTVECRFLGQDVFADGYDADDPMVLELDDGDTVALTGLPVGATCTVAETGTGGATSVALSVQQAGGDPVVTDGTSTDVVLGGEVTGEAANDVVATNTFGVGALDLTKVVDGAGAQAYGDGPFTLAVTCTFDDDGDGPSAPRTVYDSTVTLGDGGPLTAQIANLPTGALCTVTETDDGGATSTVLEPPSGQVTIGDGTTVAVTATNTFDLAPVRVVKEIAGVGIVYALGPFTVHLECTFEGEDVTVPGGADRLVTRFAAVTYDGLPVGAECSLTETDAQGATEAVVSPDALVVGEDADAIFTVTNTFAVAPLTVEKVVDGAGSAYGTGPFSVELSCQFQGRSITVPGRDVREVVPGTPVVFRGLPVGAECTVSETDDGGATSTSIEPSPVVIGQDGETLVTVTNTFDVGQVVVDKRLVGEGAGAHQGDTYVVDLACTLATAAGPTSVTLVGGSTRLLSAAGGWTAVYPTVPQGAQCTLTEVDDGGADDVTYSVAGRTGPSATFLVPSGASVSVTLTVTNTWSDVLATTGDDSGRVAVVAAVLLVSGLLLLALRRRNRPRRGPGPGVW